MTTVPKVAGDKYEDAETKLTQANLKVEKIEQTSEKVEAGVVISQNPEANTEIATGETVKVYVSSGNGKEQVVVPYVIGKTESAAKTELENVKLKIEVIYEEDKTKTDGTVLKQSVEVGNVVDEGTTIRITVNKIEQIKSGTVNVNLKSVLNYTVPTDETEEIPSVNVKITVEGETVYSESNKKDTTKITQQIRGKGTVEVKLYVDEVLKDTKSLDLNSSNTVLNFE